MPLHQFTVCNSTKQSGDGNIVFLFADLIVFFFKLLIASKNLLTFDMKGEGIFQRYEEN